MYHVELRKFPQNSHLFNLGSDELQATILDPWVGGRILEVSGQRWVPGEARLTVIEGPELAPHELTMGRGWSTAVRRGRDVTATLLASAPQPLSHAPGPPMPAAPMPSLPSASLQDFAAELLSAAQADLVSLHQAWRLAGAWFPARRAGERLDQADAAVRQLLRRDEVVLCRGTRASAGAHLVPGPEIEPLLLAADSWIGDEGSTLFLRARV